ncbi:hypothetical protein L6Q96_14665 [Candidatus Binatia bacterium]|nr:hypothetical protein [Candidatus Binatia bacterium]
MRNHCTTVRAILPATAKTIAGLLVATWPAFAAPVPTPPSASARPPALAGGAPSIDALVDRLLAAVAANDPQQLRALRVTEEEYLGIIVPWTVPPGQAPRGTSAKSAAYMWRGLETRSDYFMQALLDEFGGHVLRRTAPSFTKEPRGFAGYTAYGKLRLDVVDADGRAGVLRSGTIVDVNGQYKFIGLNWDD